MIAMASLIMYITIFVTAQAKTSLVHTSKFATLVLCNFYWIIPTDLKFGV